MNAIFVRRYYYERFMRNAMMEMSGYVRCLGYLVGFVAANNRGWNIIEYLK